MTRPPDDLAAWRKEQRARLLERREAVPPEELERWRKAIDRHLELGFPGLARGVLGFCWPHRGEHDARHVAKVFRDRGARTALPVVVKARSPLVFREWRPGEPLQEGVLGIPFPGPEAPQVEPDHALVPMVGFDDAGYRLGYGGGFFDRTLAAAAKKPTAIGIAFELSRLESIFPQAYDVPMDWVVTERGVYRRDGARLEFLGVPRDGGSGSASPVCYADEAERPEFRDE